MACDVGGTRESYSVRPGKAGIAREVGSWTGAPSSPQLCAARVGCSASACVLQPQTAGAFIGNTPSCTGTDPDSARPGQPAPFGSRPQADSAPWLLQCLQGGSSPPGVPRKQCGGVNICPPFCMYGGGQTVQWTLKLGRGVGDGKCLPPCPRCSSADLLEHVIDSLYLLILVIKQSRSVRNPVRAFDSCSCDSRQL